MRRPRSVNDQLPMDFCVPQTEWAPTPINHLPSWAEAKRISIDTETKDEFLTDLGPGIRRGGYIVGVSFAIEDGPAFYLPVGHSEGNLSPDHVFHYLRDNFSKFTGDLVGANLPYDLDYLWEAGVDTSTVKRYLDVQIAEPLIDELQFSYSLQNILARYEIPGKDEQTLEEAASAFGLDPKKELYKLPAKYVAKYAIGDVRKPLLLMRRQERIIEEQELGKVFELESRLMPCLLRMRRLGVAIDTKKLQEIEDFSVIQQRKACEKITATTGIKLDPCNVNIASVLVPILNHIGLTDIPLTDKTKKPSIKKEFLQGCKHPVTDLILRARKMDKLRGTFCNSIRTHMTKGRIHCTFNQLRRSDDADQDEQGCAFGRLSCVDPNLQQQPARDPEIGKLWRSIYIPDAGKLWCAADVNQQEPRWAIHFSVLAGCTGATEMAQRFIDDPGADNHTEMAKICFSKEELAQNFKMFRGYAKVIFLGIAYGMGGAKLCKKLGKDTAWTWSNPQNRMIEIAGPDGRKIMDQVNTNVPFLKQIALKAEKRAKSVGYVKTILGRRCRFEKDETGRILFAHKALNRVIQGSSADQMKKAIVDADAAGFPLQLQVHDELDLSVNNKEEGEAVGEIIKASIKLVLPIKVDVEFGDSWGDSMKG